MHSYSKNGIRKAKVEHTAKVKKGVKTFYTKMDQLSKLADYLLTLEEKVTEENIDSIVSELIGRDLDSMEKMIVMSKLTHKDEAEDNTK